MLHHLPTEIVENIMRQVWEDGGIIGRGNVGSMALLNRRLHHLIMGMTVELDRGLGTRERGGRGMEAGPLVQLRRQPIRPDLRVQQTIVWQDLDEAYRCMTATKMNLGWWKGIKAIFLRFVESREYGTAAHQGPRLYHFRKAHWVFLWLADVLDALLRLTGAHSLEWIRMEMRTHESLASIDSAGVFGLTQLRMIRRVEFVAPNRAAIRYFVHPRVRTWVQMSTRRKGERRWIPEGSETGWLREGDWRLRAEEERKEGETVEDAQLRWITKRLARLNRVAG